MGGPGYNFCNENTDMIIYKIKKKQTYRMYSQVCLEMRYPPIQRGKSILVECTPASGATPIVASQTSKLFIFGGGLCKFLSPTGKFKLLVKIII
jgi:hypothetical protein